MTGWDTTHLVHWMISFTVMFVYLHTRYIRRNADLEQRIPPPALPCLRRYGNIGPEERNSKGGDENIISRSREFENICASYHILFIHSTLG